jgi:DNA repair protein RadC
MSDLFFRVLSRQGRECQGWDWVRPQPAAGPLVRWGVARSGGASRAAGSRPGRGSGRVDTADLLAELLERPRASGAAAPANGHGLASEGPDGGARGRPAVGRARAHALLSARDLVELSRLEPVEWEAELGVSPREARRLAAAFALGRRLQSARRPLRPQMGSPRRVFEEVFPRLRGLEHEVFLALLLDGKHRLRRVAPVSAGTLTTSLVHPREVFRPALRAAAAAVVVAHNHPSGDPEPSREDAQVTRRLIDSGRLLGVPLLDHVVVAERGFVSLRERMAF